MDNKIHFQGLKHLGNGGLTNKKAIITENLSCKDKVDGAQATPQIQGKQLKQTDFEGQKEGQLEKKVEQLPINKQEKEPVVGRKDCTKTKDIFERDRKHAGNHNWLETINYTKHKLEPIKEEIEEPNENLNNLVNLIEGMEVEGKELGEDNKRVPNA